MAELKRKHGRGLPAIARAREDRAGARLLAHIGVYLVPVAERVDQAFVQRVGGQERAPVKQRAGVGRRLAAAFGDGGADLFGDRDGQTFGCLAGGPGEAAFGQVVGG